MSSSDEEGEGAGLPVPGLEEINESEEEDEGDGEDDDSDIDNIDAAHIARLVNQIGGLSLPTSRALSPSPSHSSSSSSSYAPSLSSSSSQSTDGLSEEFGRVLDDDELQRIHEQLSSKPVVEKFPNHLGNPGAPVSRDHRHAYERSRDALEDDNNVYAPLSSQLEWDFARWAKLRGPSSTALTELLKIEGFRERLGISFKTAKELDSIIDNELPGRPAFKHHPIEFADHTYSTFLRDIIPSIRALWSDPELSPYLILAPERHYADENKTVRLYFDMHTGRWWWRTQIELERERPGATIIPVIISSDKTQLTLFRNKSAYPIYLTIGNIPKELRRKPSFRSQILMGYLPTESLKHIKNADTRRLALAHLFHACMRRLMSPLKEAGLHGVNMTSGVGVTRRCHPLFAVFVGDYPEQCLVTLVKNGDCVICPTVHDDLGEVGYTRRMRDFEDVLDALDHGPPDGDPDTFIATCTAAGIRPISHPFWYDLPYVNVFAAITPDLLHQLSQGVMKHLLKWLKEIFGAAEIDARCAALPPNHNLRHFANGITSMKRVSGSEHRDMCRILLGLVVDLPLPHGLSSARLIRAVRALLDFFYLAQYPVHSSSEEDPANEPRPPSSLDLLEDALTRFHDNRDIFIELGVRDNFNIPKLHTLRHYVPSIKLFGTTDNYNTEYTERLHIDMAKNAYRSTNRRDEYPQMTTWLERKEKIERHALFVQWRLDGCPPLTKPAIPHHTHIKMTRNPTLKSVSFDDLAADYGAHSFRTELAKFIIRHQNEMYTENRIAREAEDIFLGFDRVPVYHKVKFWLRDPHGRELAQDTLDVAHCRPLHTPPVPRGKSKAKSKSRLPIPSRFDTVLVDVGANGQSGVKGYRVAQLRAVFRIPDRVLDELFPATPPPRHLAYVEWFKPFTTVNGNHRMYKVSRAIQNGVRSASIIPVASIRRSVHLFPLFGPHVPDGWTTNTSLELATSFYLNPTLDRLSHISLY
ncbi:uncharacterized protein STEHIDRAFT_69427 [Stereum hirsutum FP-91666 SS1]|uniref:Uncharacterized protein n=1 Tax=Stereum hirsutum (strain FP-91666) TaxID=721885 RepID=R7RW25_STEHR|nr:uncharacterized protein STEHIDRAFT_69427 [Stereum hirsutum FP-91666 SS1]EIM79496.1 hypothetical protein STEHIDRAFT_69427 [Stereum hirsutum FP-91666 SS1]